MAVVTITQADIEGVFGANFVAQWASFTQGANVTADPARITKAINIGYSRVNGLLGNGPYNIHISGSDDANPPPEIVDAMATLAGYWLFESRGLNYAKETLKWMEANRLRVENMLRQIRVGNYPIAAQYNTARRQTPRVSGCW